MAVDEQAFTMTVPEAGKRYFGLSRTSSYAAAKRGDIPVIRVGGLLRVPTKMMDRRLEGPFEIDAVHRPGDRQLN